MDRLKIKDFISMDAVQHGSKLIKVILKNRGTLIGYLHPVNQTDELDQENKWLFTYNNGKTEILDGKDISENGLRVA